MNNNAYDIGKDAEELVSKICSKMFLPDFVVKNPKFKKRNKVENEIADVLVLFDDHLIGFQVKAKQELKKASEKSDTDIDRIHKRIADGIDQLSSIKAALDIHEKINVKSSAGIEIELDSNKVHKIIGVVIIDLIGEESFPENEQSDILGGFTYHNGIPVHIFMRNDLELIAPELDTLPDFIGYLDVREQLYAREILIPYVSERDLLALYKTRPDMIQSALNGTPDCLMISEGHWDNYQKSNKAKVRDAANNPSYLIDKIITEFRASIGFEGPELNTRNDIIPGSIEGYFATINQLSSLTRLERRACGETFIPCLKRADKSGHAHSLYIFPEKKKAVLFLSTTRSQEERIRILRSLCAMAYCRFGLFEVIGIATENFSSSGRSHDFAFYKDMPFENYDDLKKEGQKVFGNIRQVRHTEYQGSTIIKAASGTKKNKIGRNERCPCQSGKKYKKCCLK